MLHSCRGIEQDYLIRKNPHVTKDGGKECILGAETTASGLADAPHHKQPEVFTEDDREPVDDITDIGIEGNQSAG